MNCKFRDSAPLHVLHSIIKPASNKNSWTKGIVSWNKWTCSLYGTDQIWLCRPLHLTLVLTCNYMSKLLFDFFTFHTFKHQFCSFHTPWHCHFLKMGTQSTCYWKVSNSKATLLGEKSVTICYPYYVCSFDLPRMENKQVSEGPNKSD